MPRSILRVIVWISIGALVFTGPIGPVNARSARLQSGELLTNPGFEDPFGVQGAANGWQPWYLTPDGVTYPTTCGDKSPETCKPYGIPVYFPAQPQDARVPPRSISGNAQKWGSSYYTYIAGVYQQVSGLTPGARLQFSAFTQAFNCSDDAGCFGGIGRKGYSYEAGENFLRVGIDPTGGTSPFSPSVVWSSYANPLDAYAQQAVEAVAQGDKATVFVWSAPQYALKHNETFVDNASLVVTGQGPAPTASATQAAQPTQAAGTPAPTVTISPDATTYTVAAGDTLSIIAQRYNLTLEQLLALNPDLTSASVIQVGQAINVSGQAPTVAATRAPTATTAPTATPQPPPIAPTATPTPIVAATVAATATSPTATPLAIAASSGLCVQAFDDLDNNLVRDASEPLVPDVVFDVKSLDGKTTATYTTSGTQEPHCFSTLPDGRYAVNTQLPADRVATTDSAWQMALLAGTNVSIMLGTRLNEPPTPEPSIEPTPAPTLETAPVAASSSNTSAPIALLGGGALILLAGVALFFGLRSRNKAA
jgi:LysM repeat protein